jgi:hypothetical protein
MNMAEQPQPKRSYISICITGLVVGCMLLLLSGLGATYYLFEYLRFGV